ncbi:PREDICTED: polycomb protein suz12-B-like [Priapulus caudatus]|uniref:Polycomb protein suz12-B-like n=1 Tax=Priapulus caudatus TaxID=37621 RepID=A0ABM1E1D5_PRICU|nr:PREDICTED: polycomb protein suz12-B-like [Priapulus caudatus]
MPPKKREKTEEVPEKTQLEQLQADHELFLQAFEKPTQIYRYLRTRSLISPILLQRTLSYMKHHMSRNNATRASFQVDSLLERATNEKLAKAECIKSGFMNLIFLGFYDSNTKIANGAATIEVIVVKICHKKRKEVSSPSKHIQIGSVEVPYNPDGSHAGPTSAVSVPSDSFNLNNGHSVKSYTMLLRATAQPSGRAAAAASPIMCNGDASELGFAVRHQQQYGSQDEARERTTALRPGGSLNWMAAVQPTERPSPSFLATAGFTFSLRALGFVGRAPLRRRQRIEVAINRTANDACVNTGKRLRRSSQSQTQATAKPGRNGPVRRSEVTQLLVIRYIADCQIFSACQLFIEEAGREVLRRRLYRNFVVHLTNLCDFGLLKSYQILTVLRQLDRLKDPPPTPPTQEPREICVANGNRTAHSVADGGHRERAARLSSADEQTGALQVVLYSCCPIDSPLCWFTEGVRGRASRTSAKAEAEATPPPPPPGVAVTTEPVKRLRIFYHFLYGSNMRQQTEARDDLHCPWCSLNCMQLYSLLKHLKLCHSRFTFTYVPHAKGARIEVAINDCYDGSYTGNPQTLVDTQRLLAYRRNGPSAPQEVNSCSYQLAWFYQVRCGRGPPSWLVYPVQCSDRLYYHTDSNRPVRANEEEVDSDDEVDPDWLRTKTIHMIDEFSDVNEGEKELTKLWNLHILKHQYIANCRSSAVSARVSLFIEEAGARCCVAASLPQTYVVPPQRTVRLRLLKSYRYSPSCGSSDRLKIPPPTPPPTTKSRGARGPREPADERRRRGGG